MANDVAFAPSSSPTTGQAPIVIVPNTAGDIADAGNIRQEPEALRQAAARMRGAEPESNLARNTRIAESQQLVLKGEASVGAIHHVAVRNLEGGPGGVNAFAAKQGEMLRFLATVEELLDKAPRAQVVAMLDSQKSQLELTIKALMRARELLPNDPRKDKKDTKDGTTTQSAPPIGATSGAEPMTTEEFRRNPDVLKAARLLSQQKVSGLDKLLETTGADPVAPAPAPAPGLPGAGAPSPDAESVAKASKIGKVLGFLEKSGYAAGGAISDLLTAELTRLKELQALLDSDATVNSQLRSLEGVLGQGKFALQTERLRTDGQQMQGFNQYIAETARWHFITDLNMTFGMQLGALGLNFSPFAAGSLPMDLMQAAISGRGDLWVKSEGVTDPETGKPMWYIPKGGNLREMLLQQYAKDGVMDQRVEAMYDRVIKQFQPIIDRFNNRVTDISLFPKGVGGGFQSVMSSIRDVLSEGAALGTVFDLDPIMQGFGESLLKTPLLDKEGKPVKDPVTDKVKVEKKPVDIKDALDNLVKDPITKADR